MKKILLASLIFLTSFAVFAQNTGNYNHRLGDARLKTPVMQEKSAAVDAGYKIVDSLENSNSRELGKKLNLGMNVSNSVELKNTTMIVQELYEKSGTIGYQAVITVEYKYTVREPKN